MKRKSFVLVVAAAVTLLFGTALAAQPEIIASVLARGTVVGQLDAKNDGVRVEREKGRADHVVATFTFEPGAKSSWHHHPGVVLVTVKSGSIQHWTEDCETEVFRAGDTFVEEGGTHLARNAGRVNAVIYATFIVPKRTPADGLSIVDDPPEDCDVP
jgi:quercetin dioxygenase-like cupin family protein